MFPVRGKEPAGVAWKVLQTRTNKLDDLRTWFNRVDVTGLAVIHKRGLSCRDFDVVASYEGWSRRRPDLASSLPTVRTARGYRVYFRNSTATYRRFDDGELISGASHYSILPPSIHPSGQRYEWHVPLADLQELDPEAEGLLTQGCYTSGASVKSVAVRRSPSQSVNDAAHRPSSQRSTVDIDYMGAHIRRLITSLIPTGPGQRHNLLFRLAAGLHQQGLALLDCKEVVRAWYEEALPYIRTKDWAENWGEFVDAYGNYDPARLGLTEAMRRAKDAPRLPVDDGYDPRVEELARLCRELQTFAATTPFFLSTHSIKDLFSTNAVQASRWLKALEADGFIRQIRKGQFKGRGSTAGEYAWVYQAPPAPPGSG